MNQRYQRAFILLTQHRYESAETELRGILSESPSEGRAHSLLAICISNNERRLDEAFDEAKQAIAYEPNESMSHYAVALVLLRRKAYRDAMTAIDEAIRLDPLDDSYWAMKARCEFSLGRFVSMLDAVKQGLLLDPENIDCRNLLSLALERTGAVGSSLEQAVETLRIDPDNDDSHAMLGFALLQNGKHMEARHAFREAFRINPMNEQARAGMMEALSSRSFLFRIVHRFYSWMSRMSGQRQMLILIGGWLLMRGLASLGKTNALIATLTLPILLVYVSFAVLTWIATPLFQTFLRFHPFGRHLLSRAETRLSNLVAPCLCLSLVGGGYALATVDILTSMGVAFYWIIATVVAVCALRTAETKGHLRYAIYAISAATLLLPIWGVYRSMQAGNYAPLSEHWQTAVWCFLGLQILQNVVAVRR